VVVGGKGGKAEIGGGAPVRPSLRSISDWDEDVRDVHGYGMVGNQASAYEAALAARSQPQVCGCVWVCACA